MEVLTSLKVYPNPSHDLFFIKPEGIDSETINVSLVNMFGKTISIFTIKNQQQFTIDANKYTLKPGLYLLVVEADNKALTQKLIVN